MSQLYSSWLLSQTFSWEFLEIHAFFNKQRFFQLGAFFNSVLLNFFMNWDSNVAQKLLNTYKHHHTETLFYLLYLCPCLDLGLFLPYLRDLFFIFVLIFIMINCVILWINTHLLFCLFVENMSYYFWKITCMKDANNCQIT